MKILVINSGSSSLKFKLFDMKKKLSLISGIVEEIGQDISNVKIVYGKKKIENRLKIKNISEALRAMQKFLEKSGMIDSFEELCGIGHRVVHGGGRFISPVVIDRDVEIEIEKLIPLAPLHNGANLDGIRSMRHLSKETPQVAVFDTAFHSSMPNYAYIYALDYSIYERDGIRRYGFHGTSHSFVLKKAMKFLKKESLNAITIHLGNGSSMCAISNSKCIDTSMGFTPLEGLVMGSRSGDIDSAILIYLAKKYALSFDELDEMLNKKSGLKGICGKSDMREIHKLASLGDLKAKLAIDIFTYRIKKYIGAYIAVIGKVDCLVFTGGIGENDYRSRCKILNNMKHLGIELDIDKNKEMTSGIREISNIDSKIKILVIPTDEELEIAMQTYLELKLLI